MTPITPTAISRKYEEAVRRLPAMYLPLLSALTAEKTETLNSVTPTEDTQRVITMRGNAA